MGFLFGGPKTPKLPEPEPAPEPKPDELVDQTALSRARTRADDVKKRKNRQSLRIPLGGTNTSSGLGIV